MIISGARKFAFIHLHKCAGTSVERAMAPYLTAGDIILGGTGEGARASVTFRNAGLHPHGTASDIYRFLGEEIYRSFNVVSIVRHPFGIAKSLIKYSFKRAKIIKFRSGIATDAGPLSGNEIKRIQSTVSESRVPFIAAALQIGGPDGDVDEFFANEAIINGKWFESQWSRLHPAENRALAPKFIGRFEDMETAWEKIAQYFGEDDMKLPHENPSGKKNKLRTQRLCKGQNCRKDGKGF